MKPLFIVIGILSLCTIKFHAAYNNLLTVCSTDITRNRTKCMTDSLDVGTKISFIGGGKNKGGLHIPTKVPSLDAFLKVFIWNETLQFSNETTSSISFNVVVYDQSGEKVVETFITLLASGTESYNIGHLTAGATYDIAVAYNGYAYWGSFTY